MTAASVARALTRPGGRVDRLGVRLGKIRHTCSTTVVRHLAALAPMATLASGCPFDPDPHHAGDAMEESVEPTPTTGPTPQPPILADAVADLAAIIGVEKSRVEVVSLEEVTWRDGSLGCASPGMMYTQSLVDGTRIVLRVEGTDYEYHAGGGKPPFHCPEPTQ